MGILDDAIREHLDLKRRHGVSEEEVQRQEEEALGPARRNVAQQPEDADEQPVAAEEAEEAPSAEEAAALPSADDTVLFDMEEDEDSEPVEPTPVEPPPVEPPPAEQSSFADDEDVGEEFALEEEGVLEAEPLGDDEDPDSESDDVLEDTPDFLQETPEHDRLWFEQKPPRDFDFD
jgi:hypothetical protein